MFMTTFSTYLVWHATAVGDVNRLTGRHLGDGRGDGEDALSRDEAQGRSAHEESLEELHCRDVYG